MCRFRGIFKYETVDMGDGRDAEYVFLAVGDDGAFHFWKKETDPRGDEKNVAEGGGDVKGGDISHWVEDVGDELDDNVSACRVPYELDVLRSEPSGKEVLYCKNNLCELCREGCGRHESWVIELVPL